MTRVNDPFPRRSRRISKPAGRCGNGPRQSNPQRPTTGNIGQPRGPSALPSRQIQWDASAGCGPGRADAPEIRTECQRANVGRAVPRILEIQGRRPNKVERIRGAVIWARWLIVLTSTPVGLSTPVSQQPPWTTNTEPSLLSTPPTMHSPSSAHPRNMFHVKPTACRGRSCTVCSVDPPPTYWMTTTDPAPNRAVQSAPSPDRSNVWIRTTSLFRTICRRPDTSRACGGRFTPTGMESLTLN